MTGLALELNQASAAEELAQGITEISEELEVEELTSAVNQLNTQLENFTAIKNLHHSIIREHIMQNLYQVNPAEQEQLKLKTENITKQLKLLDEQPKSKSPTSKQKRRAKQISYLSKQLSNIQAYTRLSQRQKVAKDGNIGIITDLKLSPGGMPEAWVQWDSSSVPIPEQPNRLEVNTQELNLNIQEQDDSRNTQQPRSINGEDIGRRSILFAETSSREITRLL